jgi:hypothetical protein
MLPLTMISKPKEKERRIGTAAQKHAVSQKSRFATGLYRAIEALPGVRIPEADPPLLIADHCGPRWVLDGSAVHYSLVHSVTM